MSQWTTKYASKLIPVEKAVRRIKNGDRVYLGSMCSEPKTMVTAMGSAGLEDIEMIQFLSGSEATALSEKRKGSFSLKSFFVSRNTSGAGPWTEADHVPLFHSEIPSFFRNRRIPVDVAVVQVSPPDRFGRFSLGISVDTTMAAVESSRLVIAQVNPRMPRTSGDTFIPGDRIDFLVDAEEELFEIPEEELGELEKTITRYTAELIDDGSILHFGFAGISRGLMDCLTNHRDLGLHTEIMTDSLVDLIETGVITNRTKKMYRGRTVATSCMGTRRLYDYMHENFLVELHPSDVALDPTFIGSNEKMVAVNLALQVDLRGQVRQGSPTWTAFEGSGGDHDFMRGANLSKGGRSIVCLRSTSPKRGRSTIVPSFGQKAAVMMNRGEANFVVTEYGAAYLGGKSIRERAMALIEIAHPDHREYLMEQARELGYVYPDQVYYKSASPELRNRIRTDHEFKDGLKAHVRAIKPIDESAIRDLFYSMSESSVYFRYFSPRKSMPHENLQKYVNISEDEGISLVVTIGPRENRKIIAEARAMIDNSGEFADVAFMVDEDFHGRGIASFLLQYLTKLAQERGLKGFTADVLTSNLPMVKVFEKTPYVLHRHYENGVVNLRWRFDEPKVDKT